MMSRSFDSSDEVLVTNSGGGGFTGARNNKTTGDKLVAKRFFDVFLFTGDERFVDLDSSLFDFAIDNNLIAKRKNKKITLNDISLRNLNGFAFSDDSGVLFREEAHFVDDFFGTNFVNDADESIENSNREKEHVFIGANAKNHDSKNKIDEVENRKSVSSDDFGDRIRVAKIGVINFTLFNLGRNLFPGKAGEIHKIIVA